MRKKTHIKICGLREPEHAIAAAKLGADFLGLVFARSKRQVTPEQATAVARAVRAALPQPPAIVGVFAGSPAPDVNRIAEECGLDLVQLSGRESWAYASQIARPVIKVIHIDEAGFGPEGLATIATHCAEASLRGHRVLLDSASDRVMGGSGKTFDWAIAAELSREFDFLLAGGLTPANVADAVTIANPWGVDVSSGVETGGVKDIAKIEAFITAARNAQVYHRRN
ncbi:MAG: phosphoribosylanthranilate isomerase [Chloroflexi bacterium]|nr:phosphoribosylanthranilate isomerase [Chloroflexota bacterium]